MLAGRECFHLKNLRVIERIGSGSFGDAYLATDGCGKHYVVKRSRNACDLTDNVQAQSDGSANRLLCDHVVKVYDVWKEQNDARVCVLMEFCDQGDMATHLRNRFPLCEGDVKSFFTQLLIGLDHVHLKHLLHRDIKLENILLASAEHGECGLIAKIADFGLSKAVTHTDAPADTRLGTPLYLSPELLSGHRYTRRTDIWSLGVVFYKMMTNTLPFGGKDMVALTASVMRTEPKHPSTATCGTYCRELGDLVMRMLNKSRSGRPCARELLASPVLSPVLDRWPWKSASFRGSVGLFACRHSVAINVRTQPSVEAEKLGTLRYGDQIFVSSAVSTAAAVDGGRELWLKVLYPLMGYCVVGILNRSFFQTLQDPNLPPPLLASPGSDTPEDATTLSCTVDVTSISPLFHIES